MEYYAVGRNEVGLCGMEASPRFTMKPKKQASKGKCKGGGCVWKIITHISLPMHETFL